jgi:1-acyl-sn-glycerol-3-phosphate acyltransferase
MFSQVAAVVFLSLLFPAPLAAAAVALARARFTPLQGLLYLLALALVKLRWRATWDGALPLTEGRGAVIVLNHRSSVDPFFVQTTTLRKIRWLVAREYCEHPAFAWFLRACEVIPVGRGGVDTAATKAALRTVESGGLVGMFPEGRINMTGELMLPGRPGAALVALKARVPLLPVYISGSPYDRFAWSPFFMTGRVRVRFGSAIDLAEYYGREDEPGVVDQIMLRCLRELARLAGRPDHEPQLAGRHWKPTAEELAAAAETGRNATSGQERGQSPPPA